MRNGLLRHQNEKKYQIPQAAKYQPAPVTGWVRKTWAQIKRVSVIALPVKDDSGIHRAALHNGPMNFKRPIYAGKANRSTTMTQHERVVSGRAKRMGISVAAYKARCA